MTATILPYPAFRKRDPKVWKGPIASIVTLREKAPPTLLQGIDRSIDDTRCALVDTSDVRGVEPVLDLDIDAERLAVMIFDRAKRNGKPCTMEKARASVWQALADAFPT